MKKNKMYHTALDIATIILLVASVICCAVLVCLQAKINHEKAIDETEWSIDFYNTAFDSGTYAVTNTTPITDKKDIKFIISEFTEITNNSIVVLECDLDKLITPVTLPAQLIALAGYNTKPVDIYCFEMYGEVDWIAYVFQFSDKYIVSYTKQTPQMSNSDDIAAYIVYYKEFDFGSKLEKIIDRYTEEVIKG